jgi:hypothetical protein
MSPQLCFFASIAFGFIAWGDRRRPIHLAGTLRPGTRRSVAAPASPGFRRGMTVNFFPCAFAPISFSTCSLYASENSRLRI